MTDFWKRECENIPLFIKERHWLIRGLGGGIIKIDKENKKIIISGSSEKYGRANH